MKTFLLAVAFFLIPTLPVFAQSESSAPSYRVDNFDLSAVRIELPAPPPAKKLRRGRVLTASNNLGPAAALTTHATNMNWAGTLSGFTDRKSVV